jgi:sodium-dependent dicarboxylate transporter 2/3/5
MAQAAGVKWLVGPAAFGVAWLALSGFDPVQQRVGSVFAFAVAMWATEALPLAVTSLLSACLLVVVGGIEEKKVFAAFGESTIPLFIGSFLLAKAMEFNRLSHRAAWGFLSLRGVTKTPARLLLALGSVTCLISLFVSNTATTAMMLPIGLSILGALHAADRGRPFALATMLMLTWGSSVAVGVMVGTPPNLIGRNLIAEATGREITFLEWMIFGMPITLLMLLAAWLVLLARYGRDQADMELEHGLAVERLREMGRMGDAERNTLIAFLVALVLWIGPDLSAMVFGSRHPVASWLQDRIPPSVAALVAACLLFLMPARDGEHGRTLTWRTGATIDWGTILLFAGGIALGQAMFQSGLAKTLGEMAVQATGADSLWAITALCIAAAILLSELASNTAAATTLVPVAIGLAQGAGVSAIPPALGVALGASLGFMLPVSTAPNAIVYSSGLVPPRQMMLSGLALDVAGFFIVLGGLRVILPLMGLDR